MGGDLNAGDTHIYSEHTELAESYPKSLRIRDKKVEEQIVKNFRVISLQEIE